jgi:hypothetical protein
VGILLMDGRTASIRENGSISNAATDREKRQDANVAMLRQSKTADMRNE